MCLIVKQNAAKPLTRDEVAAIYRRNSDGFGVAWHDDDGAVRFWRRVPVSVDDAIHLYDHAIRLATEDRPVVLHWRMATSGHVVDDLAHPFSIPGAVLVHNGVLPAWAAVAAPGQSDTAALAAHITGAVERLGVDPAEFYDTPEFRTWLQKESTGSAILIVRDGGSIDHYGNSGLTHMGRWLSNTYAGPASIYPTTYASSYRGGWSRWDDDTPPHGTPRPIGPKHVATVGGLWVQTEAGGWHYHPTADKPATVTASDKPATVQSIGAVTRRRKKAKIKRRAAIRGVCDAGVCDADALADAITRPGVLWAGTVRDVADAMLATCPAGAGWFLADDDPDVVRWGVTEYADTLRPADGLAIRVVDLPRDRVVVRVVDVVDVPRCETPDDSLPDGYPIDVATWPWPDVD